MDRFCILRGTLLNNPAVPTLQNPEEHTVHCLASVPPCYNSPFHILEDPQDQGGMYGEGWSVSDNSLLLAMARSVGGNCAECTGEGNLIAGFRVSVKGTIASRTDQTIDVQEVSLNPNFCCESNG